MYFEVKNTWVTGLVSELAHKGILSSIARSGFLKTGRGAILLRVDNGIARTNYLNRATWIDLKELHEERRAAILEAIDAYNPLVELIIVAVSRLGNSEEIVTCLVKA